MERDELEMRSSSEGVEGGDDYSKSSDNGDVEKSLLWADHEKAHRKGSFRNCLSTNISWITTVNILLFVVSAYMMWKSSNGNQITLQDNWRATSYYSPVFDRFNIPKVTRTTNGTLYDTDPPSIWRVRVGDEADAAWDRVGNRVPPIAITADEVRAIGKDPEMAVKFPEEYGFGPDAYIAGIEVFHHIHCLDKLRKEISYSHYWEKEEGPAPGRALHEAHTSHCIDILVQALMCTGSVDMVTYNWVEGRSMMMPDFENKKVCRNFDALLGWANENAVHMSDDQLKALAPPPGALRVPNTLHASHEK